MVVNRVLFYKNKPTKYRTHFISVTSTLCRALTYINLLIIYLFLSTLLLLSNKFVVENYLKNFTSLKYLNKRLNTLVT